jgi:hypothetical protein
VGTGSVQVKRCKMFLLKNGIDLKQKKKKQEKEVLTKFLSFKFLEVHSN